MSVLDIILIVVIACVFVLALRSTIKKKGCSCGCQSSEGCQGCPKCH